MAESSTPSVKPKAAAKRIRVKAVAKGYFNGRIVEVGEILDVGDDIEVGGWMQPLDPADAERLAPKLDRLKGQLPVKSPPGTDPTPVYKRR